jgi:hyaluronan synthase
MTNLVLSLGHDTLYQSTATVETLVPTHYAGLCKMYIRWGRSATREGLRALGFAPRRAVSMGPLRGALVLLDAVLQPLTVLARVCGLGAAVALGALHPMALAHGALATTIVALVYCGIFLRSERTIETVFGLLYAWFALVALPWVQPFATLTVRRNGWMTRA